MQETLIHRSRRSAALALAVGLAGSGAVAAFELMRTPLTVVLFPVTAVIGLFGMLDRRVKLRLSENGLEYAEWGPAMHPWHEFSGFRWTTWRGQPYLQLLPRRPAELRSSFSPLGKVNHFARGLVRMPRFSVAVLSLDVAPSELEEMVSRHLPRTPESPTRQESRHR